MFGRVFDEAETIGPIGAKAVNQALMNGLDRHHIEIKPPRASILLADQKPSLFKNFEMVHDGDAADIKRFGELAYAVSWMIADQIQDPPPRLMREGVKDQIHIIISNHVIT